jgi:hypothetical protein
MSADKQDADMASTRKGSSTKKDTFSPTDISQLADYTKLLLPQTAAYLKRIQHPHPAGQLSRIMRLIAKALRYGLKHRWTQPSSPHTAAYFALHALDNFEQETAPIRTNKPPSAPTIPRAPT